MAAVVALKHKQISRGGRSAPAGTWRIRRKQEAVRTYQENISRHEEVAGKKQEGIRRWQESTRRYEEVTGCSRKALKDIRRARGRRRWYQERTRRNEEVSGAHEKLTKKEHDGNRYQEPEITRRDEEEPEFLL